MNREQMIELAYLVIGESYAGPGDEPYAAACAQAVIDAVLPQVTTVDELEALPVGAHFLGEWQGGPVIGEQTKDGPVFRGWSGSSVESKLRVFGPLTVVWRPEP